MEMGEWSLQGSGNGATSSTGKIELNKNTSIYIVVNRNNFTTKYFIDWNADSIKNYDTSFDTPLNMAAYLYVGGDWNGMNGTIDEVRIYNRALSDSEISMLYNATK